MNKVIAVILFMCGSVNWYAPGFNGFFEPVIVSVGEGRITAAILIVGAVIVWFMPQPKDGAPK